MTIKCFSSIPDGLREWSQFFDTAAVVPDNDAVGTNQLVNGAVTRAKMQSETASTLLGRGPGSVGVTQELTVGGGIEFNGTALRRSAISGDVTIPAGSAAATIPAGTIDYAQLQNVTTGTVLGRGTGGAGSAEELTPGTGILVTAGAIALDPATVSGKSTGSYTASFTGATTDPAPSILYSVSGSIVVLYLNGTFATSNATTLTLTGMPAGIRPQRSFVNIGRVRDSGTTSIGTFVIDSSGVITMGLTVAASAFSNTGQKGFETGTLVFSRD